MAENNKCPRCGFEGQKNRYIHPVHSKDKDSESKGNKYLTIIVTEYYCPECKKWFKI